MPISLRPYRSPGREIEGRLHRVQVIEEAPQLIDGGEEESPALRGETSEAEQLGEALPAAQNSISASIQLHLT